MNTDYNGNVKYSLNRYVNPIYYNQKLREKLTNNLQQTYQQFYQNGHIFNNNNVQNSKLLKTTELTIVNTKHHQQRKEQRKEQRKTTKSEDDYDNKSNNTRTDTGYVSADSSLESDDDEKEIGHILEPTGCSLNEPRKCLTWACKACKKKTVSIDRRKAATLRERRRLRKVRLLFYFLF